jgi:hypothetical protein
MSSLRRGDDTLDSAEDKNARFSMVAGVEVSRERIRSLDERPAHFSGPPSPNFQCSILVLFTA